MFTTREIPNTHGGVRRSFEDVARDLRRGTGCRDVALTLISVLETRYRVFANRHKPFKFMPSKRATD